MEDEESNDRYFFFEQIPRHTTTTTHTPSSWSYPSGPGRAGLSRQLLVESPSVPSEEESGAVAARAEPQLSLCDPLLSFGGPHPRKGRGRAESEEGEGGLSPGVDLKFSLHAAGIHILARRTRGK